MPHECTNCGREFEDGSKEMLSGCPDCGGNKFQFVPAIETGPAGSPPSNRSEDSSGDDATGQPRSRPSRGSDRGDPAATNRSPSGTDGRARAWPSEDEPSEEESSIGEFAEWPDSARRPEDRDTADRSATDDSSDSFDHQSSDPFDFASSEPVSEPSTDSAVDADTTESENTAQADARTEVVSPDELPDPSAHADGLDDPDYGRVVSEPEEERPSLDQLREELNEQFESIKILRPGQYELNLMELYDREEYIVSLQEDGRYVIEVPESWRGDEE